MNRIFQILSLIVCLGVAAFGAARFFEILNFAPESTAKKPTLNLTKSKTSWQANYLKNGIVVRNQYVFLPFSKLHGQSLGDYDQIEFSTRLRIPASMKEVRPTLALYFGQIIAHDYQFFINNEAVADRRSLANNQNLMLGNYLRDNDNDLLLKVVLKTNGLSEPGFDLRSELLIGDKQDLDRISIRKMRRETELAVWLFVPQLLLCLLFAFAGVFFRYSPEYLYFAAFSGLSAIRSSIMLNLYQVPVLASLDHWVRVYCIEIALLGSLFCFTAAFFRRKSMLQRNLPLISALTVVACIIFASFYPRTDDVISVLAPLTNVFEVISLAYLSFCGFDSYVAMRKKPQASARRRTVLLIGIMAGLTLPIFAYFTFASSASWMPAPIYQACFSICIALFVVFDIIAVRVNRDRIRKKLGMLIDEEKAEHIIDAASENSKRMNDATVMFVDLRGFTAMSQAFETAEVVQAVNQYYEIVVASVHEQGGVVDKFIGDGVLAVWGMTERMDDSAIRAVRAAMGIRKRLNELNKQRLSGGEFPLAIGMGIHSGDLIAGVLGTGERAEFTVIGSTVNTAARIESHTKRCGVDILVSASSFEKIAPKILAAKVGLLPYESAYDEIHLFQVLGLVSEEFKKPEFHDDRLESFHFANEAVLLDAPFANLDYPDYLRRDITPAA